MPMRDEDLKLFAGKLRAEGINATEYGQSTDLGVEFGIEVAGLGFFSVQELNDPHNNQLLAARDFSAIKAKRSPMVKGQWV